MSPRVLVEQSRVNVLLVDDNEVNKLVVTTVLERAGYTVLVASDGQQGVDVLHDRGVDLVLMDIHMPGLNGMQATRLIRGDTGKNHAVPIVALTAAASPHDREKYRQVGINGCLEKPINVAELLELVARYLGR